MKEIYTKVSAGRRRGAYTVLTAFAVMVFFTGCEGDMKNYEQPWVDETVPMESELTGGTIESGLAKTGMYFYHYDYTGNTAYVTNSNAEIIAKYKYKP